MDTDIAFSSHRRSCLLFFFGRSQRRERIIGQKSYDRLLKKPMAEYLAQDCSEIQYEYSRLIQLFPAYQPGFSFEGNRVSVYTEGYTKLQALLRELQKAKQHIHMEYYILKMMLSGGWLEMY